MVSLGQPHDLSTITLKVLVAGCGPGPPVLSSILAPQHWSASHDVAGQVLAGCFVVSLTGTTVLFVGETFVPEYTVIN